MGIGGEVSTNEGATKETVGLLVKFASGRMNDRAIFMLRLATKEIQNALSY